MRIEASAYASAVFPVEFGRVVFRGRAIAGGTEALEAGEYRAQYADLLRQVLRMQAALGRIEPEMFLARGGVVARAIVSAGALSIDVAGRGTTLGSVEEVNATPTSFSPFGPAWMSSTAEATIGGVYNGSNGTGTLTFAVAKKGTHGVQDLQIKVYDPSFQEIETIYIDNKDPIDQEYTLSNGLVLTLGAGELVRDDTFTLDVYDSVGSVVDPDKPFNGIRNENPNLEYGLLVSAGSFEVNGVTIDVYGGDTINTVLDRITQSGAGVAATFDDVTESVVLTRKTPGPTYGIVLGNDSSGFLAAAKLEGAVSTPGEYPDMERPLAEVEEFSSVQSGTIILNGVAIDIDVNADTLVDVLDRITASEAGIVASFDASMRRVSLVREDPSEAATLDSGGTGFFSALGIWDGKYSAGGGAGGSRGLGITDSRKASIALRGFANAMNAIFRETAYNFRPGEATTQLREEIRSAISGRFDSGGSRFRTDFGISFNLESSSGEVFGLTRTGQRRLEAALRTGEGVVAVGEMLFGGEGKDREGLLDRLATILASAETDLKGYIESIGNYVDVSA